MKAKTNLHITRPEIFRAPIIRTRKEWAEFYGVSVKVIDQMIHRFGLKVKKQITPSSFTKLVKFKRHPYSKRTQFTFEDDAKIRELAPTHYKTQIAEITGLRYTSVVYYCIKNKIICKGHKQTRVYVNHWKKKQETGFFKVGNYQPI